MMRKPTMMALLLATGLQLAGRPLMRDWFTAMPEELMPTLTMNDRLDMIDYMDSGMRAVVTNQLGGQSEMTLLTDDSLVVKLSSALTAELWLEDDTTVCVRRTWHTSDGLSESQVLRFSPLWEPRQDNAPSRYEESTVTDFFN